MVKWARNLIKTLAQYQTSTSKNGMFAYLSQNSSRCRGPSDQALAQATSRSVNWVAEKRGGQSPSAGSQAGSLHTPGQRSAHRSACMLQRSSPPRLGRRFTRFYVQLEA
uniref:Uncharacterized protein n=1 Tax=Pyrodinium bahamense TaxID=73915 RepID=A0A7S0A266_9DINO|mmetsp:Transcript_19722/g.54216  ORF Transcript_19722/g.54216 Transcript_19722/m.54216 type:complete len:109 (+) Transcript_19722:308-634(+)